MFKQAVTCKRSMDRRHHRRPAFHSLAAHMPYSDVPMTYDYMGRMVTPVSIRHYILFLTIFPLYICTSGKRSFKGLYRCASTIICDEEWRTSLNMNSATKRILITLITYHIFRGLSFGANDTLYNQKVEFKLTYPVKNGRHKENIQFLGGNKFKPYLFR
ncbi:putative protein YneK [Shigella flexneri]